MGPLYLIPFLSISRLLLKSALRASKSSLLIFLGPALNPIAKSARSLILLNVHETIIQYSYRRKTLTSITCILYSSEPPCPTQSKVSKPPYSMSEHKVHPRKRCTRKGNLMFTKYVRERERERLIEGKLNYTSEVSHKAT